MKELKLKQFAVSGLTFALLLPGSAEAESLGANDPVATARLEMGSRVRLRAPGVVDGRLSGTLLRITEEALVVESDDRLVPIPRGAITELEVSAGRRSRAKKGALIGAGVGGVLTPLMMAGICKGGGFQFTGGPSSATGCSAMEYAAGAAVGAFGFAVWGALIGHWKKGDDWQPVATDGLHLTLAPARGGGLTLGLTLAF